MSNYKGIDISSHDGDIDFAKVKNDGIDFVILRAGYGWGSGNKDRLFETYYAGAKAAGIAVGAYHYSYATTIAQAEAEAKAFLERIKGKTFEYPVYFDIEDDSQRTLSVEERTDLCKAWCDIVAAAGYYVGIYSSANWFKYYLNTARLEAFDKWLAHWDVVTPWKGNEFGGMWQFSAIGKVNGINGNVDMDLSYRDYETEIKNAGLNGFEKPKPAKKEGKTVNIELPVLKKGSTGEAVKTVQRILNALGYKDTNGKALTVDGSFGANTVYAFGAFQKANGLVRDYSCGAKSWRALLTAAK